VVPFTRAELASGSWSFEARYDDSVPDSDPDPYVGRYVGAVRAFRLVIGATTLDLPVDQTEIVVSDGGGNFPNRESVRMELKAPRHPSGRFKSSNRVFGQSLSWCRSPCSPCRRSCSHSPR